MTALVETMLPRITSIEPFFSDGEWWASIRYSDGGEDEFGPFDTKEKAEGVIF
jgi:hypothetical protein